jgi:flagellar hook-associated protein 1 FlgK
VADLFRMLGFTSNALDAQRFGLDVVGQNIANVNTPGYARRVADLGAVPAVEPLSAGSGVEILGVRSLRDMLIARRLWAEVPREQREQASADALGVVEVALGTPGSSIDQRLNDFFDAFAGLADAPTSATARQEVILQAGALASSFRDLTARLDASVRDTDNRVRDGVRQVNELTSRIASLNAAFATVPPNSSEALNLRDQMTQALEQLSGLVAANAAQRSDGGYDVELAGGGTLVVGTEAYALGVSNRADSGLAELTLGDAVVTGTVTSGQIGGLLYVRDQALPAYQARLDGLAHSVAERVNATHRQGYDANGAPGEEVFVLPAGQAGAARTIAVADALNAPGGEALIAASGAGAAGDNQNARALAALRDGRFLDGGTATFVDAWSQLVYRVGQDTASARNGAATHGEVAAQIRNLQDGVSGVSLDEEAADMMRFQRAYEANARFFRAIDDTLDIMMKAFGA